MYRADPNHTALFFHRVCFVHCLLEQSYMCQSSNGFKKARLMRFLDLLSMNEKWLLG